ncbi:hypothetical protein KSS87_005138 [Heliosperma pusillum]|nr:hypothetical protein KSS87_005138 [Heliosperma pusillum]
MRFKKGTKVEVLSLKEGPSGSWRSAEIISRNSHGYAVRYEGNAEPFGKSTFDSVSRKAIRPCPPPVDLLQDWVPGDIVEVLHNCSWKMATVLKVSGHNHLFIRLFGSAVEFRANKYDVRARLCWQDGEWIVIGKASDKYEDLRFRIPTSQNANNQQRKLVTFVSGRTKCHNESTKNTNIALGSQAMSLKLLKRNLSHIVHSEVESYTRPSRKKIRLGNIESLSQYPEKVENVASLIENINGCSEMINERERRDDVSVSSSVGSCSVYRNSSHNLHHVYAAGQYEDNDSQSSDAESCYPLRSEEGNYVLPEKVVLVDEIHRLELHAYRCTLGALYESGPLSWEQELLLTNLRDSLHISTDEHLAEIRSLVSSSICFPSS